MFLQKYSVKSIPLEEAVKLIQIAERARQGRLRAMFMKQIFLQEYRAKQAKFLSEKVADLEAAALQIQKVRAGCRWSGGRCLDTARNAHQGQGELWNPKFQNSAFKGTGF